MQVDISGKTFEKSGADTYRNPNQTTMKVLVACEYSGVVRDAFTALGHHAISCDLRPTESPGKHYQGDVNDILDSGEEFDLMIAFPDCTYLTVTGNKWFKEEFKTRFPNRMEKRTDAILFFRKLYFANIPKICIENPVGIMSTNLRKPDQIVQPYWFGHKEPKKTCLWLKNLPVLKPTSIVEPEYHITKSGKRMPKWYAYADKSKGQEQRAKIRSKTFHGIAAAMADQWGGKAISL